MTTQGRKLSIVSPSQATAPDDEQGPGKGHRNKYEPEYCMQIRLMAQEGKFPEQWCAEIGVTLPTMYRWANKHEEFEEAFRISWHILAAVYTEKAISMIGQPGSQKVLLTILERRFPDIYGHNARVTHEHFEARQKGEAEQPATPAQAMDAEARQRRIDELITKKMAEQEKVDG